MKLFNRVYIIGNNTCSNRGDGAILRGLIATLNQIRPGLHLKVVSRFPSVAKWFLNREVGSDLVYELNKSTGNSVKKAFDKVMKELRLEHLYLMLKYPLFKRLFNIPRQYNSFINEISTYDLVLQVGGSFFIDLYGLFQFEALMVILLINKPVYLVGHSLGPFKRKRVNRFASLIFPRIKKIYLRELESYRYLNTLSCQLENVVVGSDTAWLLGDPIKSKIGDEEIKNDGLPIVAFTFRNLTPFDKRLGFSQEEYESNLVDLIEHLINSNHHVIVVSMCTGFDSYTIDDRIVGLRIKRRVSNQRRISVLLHEYTDLELGSIFQKCKLLIGTRLHSVILSLRYNTPALAIYYEHKSLGVLNRLNLNRYSIFIKEINTAKTIEKIDSILSNMEYEQKQIKEAVDIERTRGTEMIRSLTAQVAKDAN